MAPMNTTNPELSLLELVEKGGWIMLPIILCSVMALAIVLERFLWGLKRSRVIPEREVELFFVLISEGNFSKAMEVARSNEGSSEAPANVLGPLALLIAQQNEPVEHVRTLVNIQGKKLSHNLRRNLPTLSLIAAISPLLGLLGTVVGMIDSFQVIGSVGIGDAQALSGGIGEALLTTAAGLVVAIPTLICFRFLSERANKLLLESEAICEQAFSLVFRGGINPKAAQTAN